MDQNTLKKGSRSERPPTADERGTASRKKPESQTGNHSLSGNHVIRLCRYEPSPGLPKLISVNLRRPELRGLGRHSLERHPVHQTDATAAAENLLREPKLNPRPHVEIVSPKDSGEYPRVAWKCQASCLRRA